MLSTLSALGFSSDWLHSCPSGFQGTGFALSPDKEGVLERQPRKKQPALLCSCSLHPSTSLRPRTLSEKLWLLSPLQEVSHVQGVSTKTSLSCVFAVQCLGPNLQNSMPWPLYFKDGAGSPGLVKWVHGERITRGMWHVHCSCSVQGGLFRPTVRSAGSQKVSPGMPLARCPSTVPLAALASSSDSSPCEKGMWTVDQPFPEPRIECLVFQRKVVLSLIFWVTLLWEAKERPCCSIVLSLLCTWLLSF